MCIGITTIRDIMRKATADRISTAGVVLLGNAAEEFVIRTTKDAKKRLDELNGLRVAQGLRAIKTINELVISEVLDENYKNA